MSVEMPGRSHSTIENFLLSREALQARRNAKWSQYEADVIPAYVADMDVRVAPEVQAAIRASVDIADYGYPMRNGNKVDYAVAEAYSRRMSRLYGWQAEPELAVPLSDLVQATYAAVMAFSDAGDGIIVQVPNYPPFKAAALDTGRRFVPLHMIDDGKRHVFDLGELESRMSPDVKVFVLCNPQNPTGRVFERDELEAILAFAEKHNLIVLSDEIHSDLVHDGNRHIPFAALGAEAACRTVTLNSATKSFNIPGLRTAVMHFASPELMDRFRKRFPSRIMGSVNALGADATVAAWDHGDAWLRSIVTHLGAMRDRLILRLNSAIPSIRFYRPEATYLAWLDCSALGIEGTAFDFFHRQARVAFSPGENFSPGAEKFVRLNFATSEVILDEIIDRMIAALKSNQR
ncbi:MAG: MalY/PatB family protein [Hyphomicrobiaceae bacterium]|uniref:MalY/PatB family protein n=1 Tax=Pseudorhodoplanes sp. TaxID=1934341 RepID=UPI003D09896E